MKNYTHFICIHCQHLCDVILYLRFSGRRTPADDVGGEAPISPAPNRGPKGEHQQGGPCTGGDESIVKLVPPPNKGPKGEHQQGGPCTGEDGSIVKLVPPPTGVPRESISRADPVQGEVDQ